LDGENERESKCFRVSGDQKSEGGPEQGLVFGGNSKKFNEIAFKKAGEGRLGRKGLEKRDIAPLSYSRTHWEGDEKTKMRGRKGGFSEGNCCSPSWKETTLARKR